MEKIFYELKDFIDKSYFYDDNYNCRIINADNLLDFINWLEKEM